ncbi:MAG: type II secretion system protein [Thermoanaerobaculia bacterium]
MSRRSPGFTLLELIIVIAVIGILATIALPALKNVPRRAAEAVLKTDLRVMREVLNEYKADKGHYPVALEELVSEGYLATIPVDPITKSASTWVPLFEPFDPENPPAESELPDGATPGVFDVRSGSTALSLDGTPYYLW